MDDMERYGDYNEIDESPKKSRMLIVIKIVAAILIISIIGLIGFRLFTFNYYPDAMKRLSFTDTLTAFYYERDGEIGAMTQDLLDGSDFGYDDPDEGNFFCDNMVFIPELGQLQITLRYNTAVLDNLEEKHGLSDLDPDDESLLSFRLVGTRASDPEVEEDTPDEELGTDLGAAVTVAETDSFMMYRYFRLVFDGIDFGSSDEGDSIDWIRLEVFVKDSQTPHMILIYYNSEESPFEPYILSKDEVPK